MEPSLRGRQRVAFFGGSFDPPHEGHLSVARAARAALDLDTVLFAPVGAQPLKPNGSTAGFDDRVAMTRLAIAAEPGFAVSLVDAPKPANVPNYTLDTLLHLRNELPPEGALFCLMGADSFLGLHRWHRAAEIPFAASLIVASRPGQPLGDLKVVLPRGLGIQEGIDASPQRQHTAPSAPSLHCSRIVNASGETAAFYLISDLHADISASQIREEIRTALAGPSSDPRSGKSPDALAAFSSDAHVALSSGFLSSGPLIQPALPDAVAAYIRAHGLYRQPPGAPALARA